MKHSLRLTLAALALVAVSLCHARPGLGDLPPDYLGKDRNGNDVRLSALRGKVVIVSFWASWCKYCQKEMPVLAALQKVKGADQLAVVGVDHQDDLDTFNTVRRRWRGLDVILTYDPSDNRISKPWGVDVLPYMVMIGRDGRIAQVHVGYDETMLHQILGEVQHLLDEPAPVANATDG